MYRRGVGWVMLVGNSTNEPYMFAVISKWMFFRDPGSEWICLAHRDESEADRFAYDNTKGVERMGGQLIRGPMEIIVDIDQDNRAWVFETGRSIQRALYASKLLSY